MTSHVVMLRSFYSEVRTRNNPCWSGRIIRLAVGRGYGIPSHLGVFPHREGAVFAAHITVFPIESIVTVINRKPQ